MIVLDEYKLNLLFKEIASGFTHSPVEVLIFFILVLSIFAPFIFIYIYQLKQSRAIESCRAQKIYNQLINDKVFNRSDVDVLAQMAKYLKAFQKKNLLLENLSTFNACACRLRKEKQVPQTSISALRLKLSFKKLDPETVPHSSANLPEDMPILMIQKNKKQSSGKLLKSESNSLVIELESGGVISRTRSPIQIYFQNHTGLFSFSTYVQNCRNGLIKVAHSENIKRLQRRKFYRKKLKLPVYVKPSGSHERPVHSTFIDLGGGGASLNNIGRYFQPKDRIDLSFSTSGESQFKLKAVILRVSADDQILHVAFGYIPDSRRDRIIGYLFNRKK